MLKSGLLGKIYRDGEIIARQGELGDCMYFIQEGEAEVIQRRGDKEFCLELLKKGDFYGETALLHQEVRAATVRALGDAIVLSIEKRNFMHRIHEDASFAFKIMQKMARRIRELENALVRTTDV